MGVFFPLDKTVCITSLEVMHELEALSIYFLDREKLFTYNSSKINQPVPMG